MENNRNRNTLAAFAVNMALPLLLGGVVFLLIKDSTWIYDIIKKPAFAPDKGLFSPVWTALYGLMGLSSYMVWICGESPQRQAALRVYGLQLFFNMLWPVIFFRFRLLQLAFFELLLLLILIIWMIVLFWKVNKKSALLQIPYLLWSAFACVLNGAIVLLNQSTL